MDSREFTHLRRKLGKTQKQMAQLLGISVKAVHSYEQGWRTVPIHVERQLFFLVFRRLGTQNGKKSCWAINKCPAHRKKECPAWEFKAGGLCWFIGGTICQGEIHKNWADKMAVCRGCQVFISLLETIDNE